MKQLSFADSLNIATLISTFRGCITWHDIIDLGEEVTGRRYSKVTLAGWECIRLAYDMARRKGQWSGGNNGQRPKSKALAVAEDRIAKLVAENRMQAALIAQLHEKCVFLGENARKHGVPEAVLNAELPLPKRGRTEEKEETPARKEVNPSTKGKRGQGHEKGDERPNGRR